MVENNDRNRIADFSKRALSLRSSFYYALFALLIALALIGGLTSAWFVTESDNTENVFTAGTVNVQVESPTFFGTEGQIDNWEPGQTLSTRYTFENAGTKTMYLRASFEGFWKKYYHRNTAKVIAYHNDTELVAYDSKLFYYGQFSPDHSPDYSPEATIGFFDDYVPSKLIFPITQIESDFSNPNLLLNDNANSTGSIAPELSENGNKCVYPPSDSYSFTAYSYHTADLAKDPKERTNLFSDSLNDPDVTKVKDLFGPTDCELVTYKIGDDQNSVLDRYEDKTGFVVNINKFFDPIDNKIKFSFKSNYPIYHVFVKGGAYPAGESQSGIFYNYYSSEIGDVINANRVYSDCGLHQSNGGWSHITFYYCVPTDDPKITIEKQISNIDSGNNLTSTPPVFNYLVTNTGNVPLTDITVEDDQFGLIGTISHLPVGASEIISYSYNDWEMELLTSNVSFSLCDQASGNFNPADWVYHNGYFYYLKPIASDLELELCVNVTLDSAELEYDGAQFVLYSYFEAVQTTNGLVNVNWPDKPVLID